MSASLPGLLPWWNLLPLLGGGILVGGLFLVLTGLRQRPVRLSDALGRGSGHPRSLEVTTAAPEGAGLMDRAGSLLARRFPQDERILTMLHVQARSVGDFMAEKLVLSLIVGLTPGVAASLSWAIGAPLGTFPGALTVLGLVIGWFVPNLRLRRAGALVQTAANEAVFTYIDLVVLERLANQSSSQALTGAAVLSDNVLFRELRTSLERTRLEQRPAWQALEEVANRLEVPALRDIADVMRLDEQGAALGDTLRARLRELRDSHLMAQKIEAQRVSESLTIWMVIPAMVFGLILLAPPLLRMLSS